MIIFPYRPILVGPTRPVTTSFLVALNAAVFLGQWVVPDLLNQHSFSVDVIKNCGFMPNQEAWRLLSYMFVHAGMFGFLGNMIFLYPIGALLEERIGHWWLALVYLGCGVLNALAHSVVQGQTTVPLVGASGAIFGLIGVLVIVRPWAETQSWYVVPSHRGTCGICDCPAILLGGYYILLNLLYGLATRGQAGAQVAYLGHIVGFAAGLIAGFVFRALGTGNVAETQTVD